MDKDFQALVEQFISLICLKQGKFGRGIFPKDSFVGQRFHPKNLLIDRNPMCISQNEIYVKNSSQLLTKDKHFIELNYNYAWKGGGNVCAYEF